MSETTTPPTCPGPGIYPMTEQVYRKIPAMNCSILDWGSSDMYHLKAAIDGRLQRKDTDALEFGRAFHIRVLEPALYADRVRIIGPCESVLKSGPRKGDTCGACGKGMADGHWLCGTHAGDAATLDDDREYITPADADNIERACAAIAGRKVNNQRKAPGQFEVVVIGDLHGVRCKAKLDKLINSPFSIVDLKKVAAPTSPREVKIGLDKFEYSIDKYGYGMRAAFYCDLVQSVTGTMPRWYWLVIEDSEPFSSASYRASDACLAAGRNEYMRILMDYKACLLSGDWSGDSDTQEIDGPSRWLTRNGVTQ